MPLRPHRRNKQDSQDDKTIEINAEMQGTLSFTDAVNLKINGVFSGTLDVKGTLTIGESANVNANVNGDNIIIAGKVKGDITAMRMLVLMPTAVLDGNIVTPKLNIVEGAVFQGLCQMKEGYLDIHEVARYLEIEQDEIMALADQGKIPGTKIGSFWKFERGKIDEWAASARLK
jgi:excisionase family DNA binding protein